MGTVQVKQEAFKEIRQVSLRARIPKLVVVEDHVPYVLVLREDVGELGQRLITDFIVSDLEHLKVLDDEELLADVPEDGVSEQVVCELEVDHVVTLEAL